MENGKEVKVVPIKKQRKKQRRKRQKMLLIELFYDYSKNTTLHGLRYVTERGLSIIENLFWLVTFCVSVLFVSFLIRNVYVKWKTSPVIVSFSEELVPVGRIPFPSVTICPQIKSKQTTYNYTSVMDTYVNDYLSLIENGTAGAEIISEVEKLDDICQLCGSDEAFTDREVTDAKLVKHIEEVSPNKKNVFFECRWRGKEENCSDMFSQVFTDEGLCFSFNSLSANDIFNQENIQQNYAYLDATKQINGWSLEEGYDNNEKDTYPRRGRENGPKPDLELTLYNNIGDQDGLCNSMSSGYKIYIQHPMDFPQSSLYYYAALPDQVSSLALKFTLLSTSVTLKSYSPEQRQCYFPWDRQLQYFKIYSYNNCKIECKANYTFDACGCVKFNMPHEDSRSICTQSKKKCVENAINQLADEEMDGELASCNCLPACDSISYDAEILKTKFDFKNYVKNMMNLYANTSELDDDTASGFDAIEFSKIEMYYKEPRFVSMRRSELFGLTDFMANIGGLLGLFLGFSFLSLAEICYFITLRTCCTLKRDFENEHASAEEDVENEKTESEREIEENN